MAKIAKKAKLAKAPGAKASVATLEHYSKKLSEQIAARKKAVAEAARAAAQKAADKKKKAQLRGEISKKRAEYAKLR